MRSSSSWIRIPLIISSLIFILFPTSSRSFNLLSIHRCGTNRIIKISIQANKAVPRKLIRFLVHSREGACFDEDLIRQDREHLENSGLFDTADIKWRSGFLGWTIVIAAKEKEVIPAWRLRQIVVEGNSRTRDEVIRRELTLEKGNVIDLDGLVKSLASIEELRIFKRVGVRFIGVGKEIRDVVVEIEEGFRQVGFVLPTYSSDNPDLGGFGLTGGYINVNLRGTGNWAGIGGMWAKDKAIIAGLYFPRFLGTHQQVYSGLGYSERDQELFDEDIEETGEKYRLKVYGFGAGWDIPLKRWDLFHGLAVLKTDTDPIAGIPPTGGGLSPLYSVSLSYNTRDSNLDPLTGWVIGFRVDLGHFFPNNDEFEDERNIIRVNPSIRRFIHLFGRHRLALRLKAGTSLTEPAYLSQYFLGGANDLRGYPSGSIVADTYWLFNAEYRFPIYRLNEEITIDGALFTDMGMDFNRYDDDDNKNELRRSVGLGLRPIIGPMVIRIDFGIAPTTRGFYFQYSHTF
jgi:outer membrane protein insertion porin family